MKAQDIVFRVIWLPFGTIICWVFFQILAHGVKIASWEFTNDAFLDAFFYALFLTGIELVYSLVTTVLREDK